MELAYQGSELELFAQARQWKAYVRKALHPFIGGSVYPFLCSEFDRAIGHYRHYTKGMLRHLTPAGTRIEAEFYLDSVGMLASADNRALLRQSLPTLRQVLFWDRALVPLSRLLDPLTGRSFGRSVVTVWRKA